MNSQKIIFDERKFDHGINKLKILIFIENDEEDFEQQLNEVIEQSKIKILYNVGVNQLKYQVKTTVHDSLNPNQQTLINLSDSIYKQLFNDLMNVGIISGKQLNNSIKLLLTFYLKYEKTSESTINFLFKHLDEKDKQDLFQDSQGYFAPGIQSNILQTTEIKKNQINDDGLQSDIIYNVINQQSQIQSKLYDDKTCKSDLINKQSDRQQENKISTIKNDQILSPAEQAQSILYVQENVSSIISDLVPPGIIGSEGQNPKIVSEIIPPQQLYLDSNIKVEIQDEKISSLGPPHLETQKLQVQNNNQVNGSTNSVKTIESGATDSIKQIESKNIQVSPQYKLVFDKDVEPIIQEPKLPAPIIYHNFKKCERFQCLK